MIEIQRITKSLTYERIKELMSSLGMPNSLALLSTIKQAVREASPDPWNEVIVDKDELESLESSIKTLEELRDSTILGLQIENDRCKKELEEKQFYILGLEKELTYWRTKDE